MSFTPRQHFSINKNLIHCQPCSYCNYHFNTFQPQHHNYQQTSHFLYVTAPGESSNSNWLVYVGYLLFWCCYCWKPYRVNQDCFHAVKGKISSSLEVVTNQQEADYNRVLKHVGKWMECMWSAFGSYVCCLELRREEIAMNATEVKPIKELEPSKTSAIDRRLFVFVHKGYTYSLHDMPRSWPSIFQLNSIIGLQEVSTALLMVMVVVMQLLR